MHAGDSPATFASTLPEGSRKEEAIMRMLREDPAAPDAEVGDEFDPEQDPVREYVTVDDPS